MLKYLFQIVFFLHISTVALLAQQAKIDLPFTTVQDIDELLQNQFQKQGQRLLQIYLIRHAKPNLKKRFFCSADQAQNYLDNYNSAPVCELPSAYVSIELIKPHQIYCSSLPRSQETALRLFGNSYPIVSDSVFREFELKIVNAQSIIKLPLDLWKGVSRMSWFLGFNHRGIESLKKAKERVVFSADNLEKLANQEETAILVGHGMINASIAKELKRRGWTIVQKKGHLNLGATILQKVVPL
ncbi:histidine phosphatase family protein [Ancylomarina salipaludis]|uniref:Histidine phosphatase family protein n=1 Tax=Ancylomarina salipaludis TaxID=2501299 RepID=A0A4Q1JJ07_9BACT|nr:histidine phosphatase family protein [Ancylomarina salipaludis]RXQ88123.1 histidine phosphatase family protein [Ancylomarina salipaludis]